MKIKCYFGALLTAALLTVSCESSSDVPENGITANPAELQAAAQTGQWSITYFFDTDSDETSDFTGYVFTFSPDGSVTAEKDGTQVTGTWSVTSDSGSSSDDSDDSPDDSDDSDDVDFNLLFTAPADFEELSDDWDILEYTDNRIRLIDVSGGNGGTDYLTFEKV